MFFYEDPVSLYGQNDWNFMKYFMKYFYCISQKS